MKYIVESSKGRKWRYDSLDEIRKDWNVSGNFSLLRVKLSVVNSCKLYEDVDKREEAIYKRLRKVKRNSKFMVGQEITLKDYSLRESYRDHDGEGAVLREKFTENGNKWLIEWVDGENTFVNEDNIR